MLLYNTSSCLGGDEGGRERERGGKSESERKKEPNVRDSFLSLSFSVFLSVLSLTEEGRQQ